MGSFSCHLQQLLIFILLLIKAVPTSGHDKTVEQQLRQDATNLQTDLETRAMALFNRYPVLLKQNQTEDAETTLREAMAVAPWLPLPYRVLAGHIMDYGNQGQIGEIIDLYRHAMRIEHALPREGTTPEELMKQLQKRGSIAPVFKGQTFLSRLKHDREQLLLLGERGKLPQSLVDRYVGGYNELLSLIPPVKWNQMVTIPAKIWAKTVGNVYQRALYVPEMKPLDGPALNPNLNFTALEEEYLSADPSFIYFDDLLTESALLRLREYYEEATVFHDAKPGYVGSYIMDGGFGNPVIAQLIEELYAAFPRIICSHKLSHAWAYKYDSEVQMPIATHADVAAVNFNFWISPNEGSLDKDAGGLTVFKVVPPEGTPMSVFNHMPLHENVTRMLAETEFANYSIPFKTNRAIVFQSNLFHESGRMHWAPGYTKRRINLTLLFGKMYSKCDDVEDASKTCSPDDSTGP